MFNLLASDGIAEIVTLSDILQRFFFLDATHKHLLVFLIRLLLLCFPSSTSMSKIQVHVQTPCTLKNPNETEIPLFQKSLIYTHLSLLTENFILTRSGPKKKGGKPRLMLFPGMSDKHLGCKLIFIRSLSLFTCSSNQSGAVYLISSVHKQGSDYGH